MSRGSKLSLWIAAIAFLGWRASACSSNSSGPAADFTVAVDTPTATTLGTQVVLHVHLASTGDSGDVVLHVTGADTSWDVTLPVGPVTLTTNGQKSANVLIAVPTNGASAPTGRSVTVDAAIGSLHHSAATSVTVANQLVIPIQRGAGAGTASHWPFANSTTFHLNAGTMVTFRNDDTLGHIIHSNGAIGIAHQAIGSPTLPGDTYSQTTSGSGSALVTCHSHVADTLFFAIP